MAEGKVLRYRNQNVRCLFDLIGIRNVCVRTGSARKGLDCLLAEGPYEDPQAMDLHKVTIKDKAFTKC